jgi:DNA invertase Pin-like site-specific DNA recombinase
MQLRELREYCGRRGWDIVREYVDTGWSGAKASRPELDRLMKDARRRKCDAVVVWKLDRWGRSLAHLLQSVQELSGLGIRFVAMTQNIDTDESNPMARLLMHLMAAFAEFEREMIRERVKAGVRNAQAKGKRLGRPRRVFRKDKALEMRAAGMAWRRVAEVLQVPLATLVDRCSEIPVADSREEERKQRRLA